MKAAASKKPGHRPSVRPALNGWIPRLGFLLLVAGVLAVFWGVLSGEFLIWDDNTSIYENPYLGGLNWARVQWAFQDWTQSNRFMPLTWLGFSAIFSLGGLDPAKFHAAPLLLHAVNGVLLFGVLRRQLRMVHPATDPGWREWGAWFATGLWLFHPLRVEVVAWALTLTYELAWCGLLLAWGCLLRARATGRMGWLWAAAAAYTASLLAYPVGISAWLAFLILGTWLAAHAAGPVIPRWRTKLLLLAIPGLLVTGLTLWFRWHGAGIWIASSDLNRFGPLDRAAQAVYVWAYYLWRPWLPADVAPIYGTLLRVEPLAGRFLVSGGLVAAGCLLAWWGRNKWPGLGAWWWATAALLLPVMGLTEHPFFTSDRYAGLPGLALAVLLAEGWSRVSGRRWRWWLGGITGGLLAGCVIMTARQVPRWNNTGRLFSYVATITRDPMVLAECHLRQALVAEADGDYATARQETRQGLALAPYQRTLLGLAARLAAPPPPVPPAAATQVELARFALSRNDPATTEAHFLRAVRLGPQLREPRLRLALLLLAQGATRDALAHFQWVRGSGAVDLDRRFLAEMETVATRQGDACLARAVRRQLNRLAVQR